MTKFKIFLSTSILCILCLACKTTSTDLITPETPAIERSIEQVQEVSQIFLVRHAEKSKDDPKDPNLTEEGRARAERLKFHLINAGITSIYTTDYNRTKQTIMPLAIALGIEPIIYNPDLVDITLILKQTAAGNIVVAGHSNTTPKLVNKLLGLEKYKSLDESVYDQLFLVSKFGDQFTSTVMQY